MALEDEKTLQLRKQIYDLEIDNLKLNTENRDAHEKIARLKRDINVRSAAYNRIFDEKVGLEAELAKYEWIAIEDGFKDGNPKGYNFLMLWRPIDHYQRPQHIEIIIGSFSYQDKEGKAVGTPSRVWANGRHYDIETHITHFMPLPSKELNQ